MKFFVFYFIFWINIEYFSHFRQDKTELITFSQIAYLNSFDQIKSHDWNNAPTLLLYRWRIGGMCFTALDGKLCHFKNIIVCYFLNYFLLINILKYLKTLNKKNLNFKFFLKCKNNEELVILWNLSLPIYINICVCVCVCGALYCIDT